MIQRDDMVGYEYRIVAMSVSDLKLVPSKQGRKIDWKHVDKIASVFKPALAVVTVSAASNMMLGGNHTVLAADKAGIHRLDVRVIDNLTPAQEDEIVSNLTIQKSWSGMAKFPLRVAMGDPVATAVKNARETSGVKVTVREYSLEEVERSDGNLLDTLLFLKDLYPGETIDGALVRAFSWAIAADMKLTNTTVQRLRNNLASTARDARNLAKGYGGRSTEQELLRRIAVAYDKDLSVTPRISKNLSYRFPWFDKDKRIQE